LAIDYRAKFFKMPRRESSMSDLKRAERLQIMLTDDEVRALDDWRFKRRMPSRASAVRELLKRGLAADGFDSADARTKSSDFRIVDAVSTRKPRARQ
jgi:hypothetical protein